MHVSLTTGNITASAVVFALIAPWVYLVTTESWLARQRRLRRERIEEARESRVTDLPRREERDG